MVKNELLYNFQHSIVIKNVMYFIGVLNNHSVYQIPLQDIKEIIRRKLATKAV